MNLLLNNGLNLSLQHPFWEGVLLATVFLVALSLLRQHSAFILALYASILLTIADTITHWQPSLALAADSKPQVISDKPLNSHSNLLKSELHHIGTAYYYTSTEVQEPLADELHQILWILGHIEEQ